MTCIVFCGPTVSVASARVRLPALFLPPCAAADIYNAVRLHKPRAIGIIDGYFEVRPAVWHKEILYAISQGVTVFGASSMGALRAAELHAYGMRGVGAIFEAYAAGDLEDDDAVAVTHAAEEDGYRLISTALVNIRHGLHLAKASDLIDEDEQGFLLGSARALHYPLRCWNAVWRAARDSGMAAHRVAALRDFIDRTGPDLKRDDALLMLDAMAAFLASGEVPPVLPEPFEPTIFWDHLCSHYATEPARGIDTHHGISRERLLNHIKLAAPERDTLRRDALLQHLVAQEVARIGAAPPDDRDSLTRFRRIRGLSAPADLNHWMAERGLGPQDCLDMARYEANCRHLQSYHATAIDARLTHAAKQRDCYRPAEDAAAAKWRRLHDDGIANPSAKHVDSMDAVLAWYQSRFGRVHTTVETHAAELGFGSVALFTNELVAAYIAEQTQDHALQEPAHALLS